MGMSTGSSGSQTPHPQVNVTPLVDVTLVVLIIFMVVTPLAMKTFWVNLPNKPDPNVPAVVDAQAPLVMTIASDGTIRVDSTVLSRDEIADRLPGMLAAKEKSRRVLYFDAHDEVPYGTAVEVMDLARAGGARTLAISTQAIAAK